MAPSTPSPGLFQRLLQWLGLAKKPKALSAKRRSKSGKKPSRRPARSSRSAGGDGWMPPRPVESLSAADLRLSIREAVLEDREELLAGGGASAKADAAFLDRLATILASRSLELPTFPKVSLELDRLMREGEPQNPELAQLLTSDPDLLRRVWKRANCALYRVQVTDVDRAISRLGHDEVWRIGMAACLQGEVFRAGPFQARVEQLRVSGMIAGCLASWVDKSPRGEAYLAGLMQAAGAMYLLRVAAMDRRSIPSEACLEQTLSRYQTAFSVLMVRTWELGDKVAAAVGYYPRPADAPEEHRALAEVLRIGIVGAHVGRTSLSGGGAADDRVLLKSYAGDRVDVDRLIKRSVRDWTAEGEGENGLEVVEEVRKSA